MAKIVVDIDLSPGLLISANELGELLVNNLRKEVPKRSGELVGTISMTPAQKLGDKYLVSVTVGDDQHPYAETILDGVDESEEIYHLGNPIMHFPEDRWPNGPKELLGKDGWFHFRKIHYHIPANDYVGRAIDRLRNIAEIIVKNINRE